MSGSFLLQACIFLAAAVAAVPLARRFGFGSALGYLAAGVVIGPHLLGLIGADAGESVMHFAEFGVVLMLFLIGLELDPGKLWRMRVPIIGMGGLQVGITTAVVAAICMALGLEWQSAVAVGLILSLSSTAMVLQTMQEKGWSRTPSGVRSFSVLLFQDIAVIPMLALMPLLALPGVSPVIEAGHGLAADRPAWVQALLVIAVVGAMVLLGKTVTGPVFRYVARTRSQELLMAASLLVVLGITLLMNLVGLSPALGAFIAGVVLAESEFRHELESNIEPFKGLLLGLFFISVGASLNLGIVDQSPWLVAGLVLALVVVKFTILYFIGRFFRLALADSLLFAFALAQGGEFAFLLVSFALQTGALTNPVANLLVVVVVISMALTPVLILVFERLIRPRLARSCDTEPRDEEMPEEANPVIIAGYGRFGQVVGRLLKASGYRTTLLDHSAGQIELTSRFGNKVFYGDASRMELLHAAGAERAELLVVAIDDRRKAAQMVEAARKAFPHLKILARAIDRPHAYDLQKAGAHFIARETFGSALMVGREALYQLGVAPERAARMAETFERHDQESMVKLYQYWGDDAAYGFRMRKNLEALQQVLQDDAETAGEAPAEDLGEERPLPDSA